HETDLTQGLLTVLRQNLLTGTKEGCASGDCGACTVLVARDGVVQTVNSCITPTGAVLDAGVLTVEGVAQDNLLHPVQKHMVAQHGSQCGFCTPGFVMSMVGGLLEDAAEMQHRTSAVHTISGNLCRCTGYRPIIAALQEASGDPQLEAAQAHLGWLYAIENTQQRSASYIRPTSLDELLQACQSLAEHAEEGLLVAGTTDAWLPVNRDYVDYRYVVDMSMVDELAQIEDVGGELVLGANVSHARLQQYFGEKPHHCEAIRAMLRRFGSPQIRNRGTLGGNIAGASPIADWPPVLLALDARVKLIDFSGRSRSLPLSEFFLDYKQTRRRPDELITAVAFKIPPDWSALQVFKITKREEDDISSLLGAFYLELDDPRQTITNCRIAFGGMAAVPVRIAPLEQVLTGLPVAELNESRVDGLLRQLAEHLHPITDARATAAYRLEVAGNLLAKVLRGIKSSSELSLTDLSLETLYPLPGVAE
ncbi:MAG: FAD binding domain-containing protein, partial [Pseudomonadota bacterium]